MNNISRVDIPNLDNYPSQDAKLSAIVGCLQSIVEACSADLEHLDSSDISDFDDRVATLILINKNT